MSRNIKVDEQTKAIKESIDRMDECKHLYNEVCTNPSSQQCCDYPHPAYCLHRCPHFEHEDGIIVSTENDTCSDEDIERSCDYHKYRDIYQAMRNNA